MAEFVGAVCTEFWNRRSRMLFLSSTVLNHQLGFADCADGLVRRCEVASPQNFPHSSEEQVFSEDLGTVKVWLLRYNSNLRPIG